MSRDSCRLCLAAGAAASGCIFGPCRAYTGRPQSAGWLHEFGRERVTARHVLRARRAGLERERLRRVVQRPQRQPVPAVLHAMRARLVRGCVHRVLGGRVLVRPTGRLRGRVRARLPRLQLPRLPSRQCHCQWLQPGPRWLLLRHERDVRWGHCALVHRGAGEHFVRGAAPAILRLPAVFAVHPSRG